MEKLLNAMVERLKTAAGDNLKSVILYGSAATGEFQKGYSDLNLLCVFEKLDAQVLMKVSEPVRWWVKQGQPLPLVFTRSGLEGSADVFAIELHDIKLKHRVLYGEDVLAGLEVPMHLHRVELERELRTNLLRLRENYLLAAGDRKRVLALMVDSISTFATLFRHMLIACGEVPPGGKRMAVCRAGEVFELDVTPFLTILDFRDGRKRERELDIERLFAEYLSGVAHLVEEVDRFAAPSKD